MADTKMATLASMYTAVPPQVGRFFCVQITIVKVWQPSTRGTTHLGSEHFRECCLQNPSLSRTHSHNCSTYRRDGWLG
ncbi:hypothetical protein Y032_0002g873 [Ancylostoma ceylanicum]|uniref:Uncharacterized protein n=1 Tax=Ancylostoma ceylanicum TaxID=53326 RepID=A0A016W2T8_9BILA|nr:hypothetical protein Y032_0002g873 [Ancylostoma ceylanicum]